MATNCFVSDHLQSHYRRIYSAKGRIDNSPPLSMLKDVRRKQFRTKKASVNMQKDSRDERLESSHQGVVYGECIQFVDYETTTVSRKENVFHTQTGRDVSILNETRSKRQPDSPPKLKWRPVLGTNSRKSHLTEYPTLDAKDVGICGDKVTVSSTSNEYCGSIDKCDEPPASELGTKKRPFRNIVDLKERNNALKESIAQSELEYHYNEFLLAVTADILSSGVQSDSDIESIFARHIRLHKHRLREDVMLKKVATLREDVLTRY